MIYPEYIKDTSLFGYFNQMVAVNGFTSRFLFANKSHKYIKKNHPVYISPFLTETHSAGLGETIGELIPPDVFEELKESAAKACHPFDAASPVTHDLLFDRELKYCPKCMAGGEHYYYQQLRTVSTCAKHGIPLTKGCPVCGMPLSASIEVVELDGFHCPHCMSRIADFRDPAELVCMLDDAKKSGSEEPKRIHFDETKVHLASMSRTEEVFYSPQFEKDLFSYMETGIRPDGAIEIKKGGKAVISSMSLVIPYSGGYLNKRSKPSDILYFIGESEHPMAGPEHKAGAYLARKLITDQTPRRLGIESMATTRRLFIKALRQTGIEEPDLVLSEALKHYASDMYRHVLELFTKSGNVPIFIMTAKKPVSEIRYAMMILEDESNYYLYMYRSENEPETEFLAVNMAGKTEKLGNLTINTYALDNHLQLNSPERMREEGNHDENRTEYHSERPCTDNAPPVDSREADLSGHGQDNWLSDRGREAGSP